MTSTDQPRPGVGVLDTDLVVLFQRLDPAQLPSRPRITAITLAELSVGPLVTDDPEERSVRQARLQETEASFDPLPFDALIAATALANDLPVFTCNPDDFGGISELEVVPVPHPDAARSR